jgi:hypothetical protein
LVIPFEKESEALVPGTICSLKVRIVVERALDAVP